VLAARVWGAIPTLDMPVTERPSLSSSRFALARTTEVRRPTAWLRILVGALLIVTVVAAADKMRTGAQKYSGGLLRVETIGQGQFLTWQLAVLGVLGGGVLASAGTGAGIRHGVLTGLLGAAWVVGFAVSMGEPFPPIAYWLSKLSLGGIPPDDPTVMLAAASGIFTLAVCGGWLGGTLFLPLAPEHMRKPLGVGFD
jgi:hypothetical protein